MADEKSISGSFTAATVRVPFVADTASLDKARDDLDRWAQEFKRAFEDSIKTLVGKLKELTDEGARVGVSINEAANRAAGASVSLQAAIAAAEAADRGRGHRAGFVGGCRASCLVG